MFTQVEIVCPQCGRTYVAEVEDGATEQGTCPDCGAHVFR